jgi:AmiR/NasT family two-component response regulator
MSIQGLETAVAAPRSELEAARAQVESLHVALETRTAIGIAVGTLMVERTLTDTMAFRAPGRAVHTPRHQDS